MCEKKEFKKKQLNKNDYKKDEKVVGGVKKILGALGVLGSLALSYVFKGKFEISKKD